MSNASTASNERPDRPRKWTVMVFMGAEADGNAPMVEAANADLKEMRAVGSSPNLNIFAQLHANGTAHRHHIGVDPPHGRPVPPEECDVTNGRALVEFMRDSLTRTGYEHDPSDYSMLVLWGHAYNFAIGHKKTADGANDALDFVELGKVLKGFQLDMKRRYERQIGREMEDVPKLDIIAFDACDVATIELACELEPFGKYLLGSQIGVPIPGWPYDRVLGRLRHKEGRRVMGPAEFGSWTTRRYCRAYAPEHRTVSLSLLDLKRVPELFAHTDVLATALDFALDRGPDARGRIADMFSRAQTADYKPFVDVADLCLNLVRESDDPLVREAAKALGDFLLSPRPEVVGASNEGSGWPFIVESGRNSGATAKLNGVSIYAPHVALINDFEALEPLYAQFRFARETRWSTLVHDLARLQALV